MLPTKSILFGFLGWVFPFLYIIEKSNSGYNV
jgi:hypothetical protein